MTSLLWSKATLSQRLERLVRVSRFSTNWIFAGTSIGLMVSRSFVPLCTGRGLSTAPTHPKHGARRVLFRSDDQPFESIPRLVRVSHFSTNWIFAGTSIGLMVSRSFVPLYHVWMDMSHILR